MSTVYDPRGKNNQRVQRPSRCPPESFLNQIEARRYEFLAAQFRDLDRPVLAQMCQNWAREHLLTITKLAEMEDRLAELDARLRAQSEGAWS